MRTHYGPWQPYWISNQHQKHKSGKGPPNEHFWQVWLKSVQRFQRRWVKCEKLTDGRTTDAYPWQKLTWPMARWAKKAFHSYSSNGSMSNNFLWWWPSWNSYSYKKKLLKGSCYEFSWTAGFNDQLITCI